MGLTQELEIVRLTLIRAEHQGQITYGHQQIKSLVKGARYCMQGSHHYLSRDIGSPRAKEQSSQNSHLEQHGWNLLGFDLLILHHKVERTHIIAYVAGLQR